MQTLSDVLYNNLSTDYKGACGVDFNSENELAYNATALTWSPADQPVGVSKTIRSLKHFIHGPISLNTFLSTLHDKY